MMAGKLMSACMMVKNEEGNLPRCLSSLRNFVDEIVIIDTGSTDRTMEIARQFGSDNDIPVGIFEHPWENDFSKHRNQSLSYSTCKWSFVIDADEEVILKEGTDWKRVRKFFWNLPDRFPASAVEFRDIQNGKETMIFNTSRFFRRGKARYQGIVHNQVTVNGEALFCPGIYIKHYGYCLTPEKTKEKFERTNTLLMKQIETGEMNDYLPYYYLCQLYARAGDKKEAAEWGEKYIKEKTKIKNFNPQIYFTVIRQYMALDEGKRAGELLQIAIEELPGNVDIAQVAFDYALCTGDKVLQYSAGRDFVEAYRQFQKNPGLKKNMFTFSLREDVLSIILKRLIEIQLEQATQDLSELLNSRKNCDMPLKDQLLIELEANLATTAFPLKFVKKQTKEEIENGREDKGNC
jgi:glycosyltransferase involved in cell wall biosynthesis